MLQKIIRDKLIKTKINDDDIVRACFLDGLYQAINDYHKKYESYETKAEAMLVFNTVNSINNALDTEHNAENIKVINKDNDATT